MGVFSCARTSDESLERFFEVHFGKESKFEGRVGVFLRTRRGKMRTVAWFPTDERLPSRLRGLKAYDGKDYYVTPNAFNRNERSTERLFQLRNVVVDLDDHGAVGPDGEADRNRACDAMETLLTDGICAEYGIPTPNSVVRTGRGLQLWYRIEDASYKLAGAYEETASRLRKAFAEIVSDVPSISGILSVDDGASGVAVGLARLPGSKNPKTGTTVEVSTLNDATTNVLDFETESRTRRPRKERAERTPGRKTFGIDGAELARRRLKAMRGFVASRRKRGDGCEGFRDVVLLVSYCSLWESGMTEAEKDAEVARLNETFEKPLPELEWRRYLSTARRKKYRYSDERIAELLGLDDEERTRLGLSKRRRTKTSKRNGADDERIRKACEAGASKRDVAAMSACSPQTAARRLERLGLKTKRERRLEAALSAAKNGATAKELSNRFGYGRSRAWEIVAKARRIVENERFRALRRETIAKNAAKRDESPKSPSSSASSGKPFRSVRKIPAGRHINGSLMRPERGVRQGDDFMFFERVETARKPSADALRKSVRGHNEDEANNDERI